MFDSRGKYIAFTHEGYLFNAKNKQAVAYYDENLDIFISNGKYFGEIRAGDLLLYNIRSTHINKTFQTAPTPTTPPIKATPPTHKTPMAQPSNWVDVEL